MAAVTVLAGVAAAGVALAGIVKNSTRGESKAAAPPPSAEVRRRVMELEDLPSVSETLYNPPPSPRTYAPGGDSLKTYRGASVYTPGLVNRSGSGMYASPQVHHASQEYQDQDDWQYDCNGMRCDYSGGTCPAGDPNSSGDMPPYRGQHLERPVGLLGDYIPGVQQDTGRDASSELNEDPCPTKTYPDYGIGWGDPLESSYIPHGAHAQTDLEFWGPRDYDAERNHKIPSYLFNREQELNGKEINRPYDDYTVTFDEGEDGSKEVGWGQGEKSARSADVKYLAANNSQVFASFTRADEEKKFMPPVANRGGFSMPAPESQIYFGQRTEPVFNAFSGVKDIGGRAAPPQQADIQLPPHTRNLQIYQPYSGGPVAKTRSYGAEGVNLVAGGRINRRIDFTPFVSRGVGMGGETPAGLDLNPQAEERVRRVGTRFTLGRDDEFDPDAVVPGVWDTKGVAAFGVAANSGNEINPPEGGFMRRTRVRERPFSESTIGLGMPGAGGPLRLFDMMAGARFTKSDGNRQFYGNSAGGASKYIGSADPKMINKKSDGNRQYYGNSAGGASKFVGGADPISLKKSTLYKPPCSGATGGPGGMQAPRGVFSVHGNLAIGTRGATYSEEPTADYVGDAINGSLYKNIVVARSESALDDLFSVEHS